MILLLSNHSGNANEIYITQVGDLTDMDIIQDGENNKVRSLNTTSGRASIRGNNKTFTLSQTGDNNRAGFWTHGGNQQMVILQNGDSNIAALDNHGNNNNMTLTQDGDNNQAHIEIGNGGDNDNATVSYTHLTLPTKA